MIVVSRHFVERSEIEWDKGTNRWATYAYLYPKHDLFKTFTVDGGMFQDAARALPLYKGPSYFVAHRDNNGENELTSFQIGCDYDHLHDDHYSHHGDDDPPADVFENAEKLFQHLSQRSSCN